MAGVEDPRGAIRPSNPPPDVGLAALADRQHGVTDHRQLRRPGLSRRHRAPRPQRPLAAAIPRRLCGRAEDRPATDWPAYSRAPPLPRGPRGSLGTSEPARRCRRQRRSRERPLFRSPRRPPQSAVVRTPRERGLTTAASSPSAGPNSVGNLAIVPALPRPPGGGRSSRTAASLAQVPLTGSGEARKDVPLVPQGRARP